MGRYNKCIGQPSIQIFRNGAIVPRDSMKSGGSKLPPTVRREKLEKLLVDWDTTHKAIINQKNNMIICNGNCYSGITLDYFCDVANIDPFCDGLTYLGIDIKLRKGEK